MQKLVAEEIQAQLYNPADLLDWGQLRVDQDDFNQLLLAINIAMDIFATYKSNDSCQNSWDFRENSKIFLPCTCLFDLSSNLNAYLQRTIRLVHQLGFDNLNIDATHG